MNELKSLIRGTLIDVACIGAMVMQVQNPVTYWDFLGGIGYFLQCVFIWMGLLIMPPILFVMRAMHHLQQHDPQVIIRVSNVDKAQAAFARLQESSQMYRKLVTGRELVFCTVFAGMDWWWLAVGNLVTLGLLRLVWSAPKLQLSSTT